MAEVFRPVYYVDPATGKRVRRSFPARSGASQRPGISATTRRTDNGTKSKAIPTRKRPKPKRRSWSTAAFA